MAYASKLGAAAEIATVIATELQAESAIRDQARSRTRRRSEDLADTLRRGRARQRGIHGPLAPRGTAAAETRVQAVRRASALAVQLRSVRPADPSWSAPPGIEGRARHVGARGHVVFGGRLPLEPSNFVERAMTQKSRRSTATCGTGTSFAAGPRGLRRSSSRCPRLAPVSHGDRGSLPSRVRRLRRRRHRRPSRRGAHLGRAHGGRSDSARTSSPARRHARRAADGARARRPPACAASRRPSLRRRCGCATRRGSH